MRLRKFEVRSYRSCAHTKIELNKKLTALVGVNGSGKSNILKSLMLLSQIGLIAKRGAYHRENTRPNKCEIIAEFEYKKKIITISGRIFFETDDENDDHIVSAKINWDISKYIDHKELIPFPIELLAYGNRVLDRHGALFVRGPNYFWSPNKENIKIYTKALPYVQQVINYIDSFSYYGASQFSDPSKCPNFIEIEDDKLVRKYRSESGHYRFIIDLYQAYKHKDSAEYQRFESTVNKLGIGLIDKIDFEEVTIPSSSFKVSAGGNYRTIERKRVLVIPIFTIDKNKLSPSQLSEGTFRTLALLYYLLTDTSNLLIIEEPEVCVHHGLLNSIVSLIITQSAKKQIVISTHSDFVLDQVEPTDVLVVKRSAKKGTEVQKLNKELSTNDFEALKEYLEESGNLGEYWKEAGF